MEAVLWNVLIVGVTSTMAACYAKPSERWLTFQIFVYVGIFFSVAFWLVFLFLNLTGEFA